MITNKIYSYFYSNFVKQSCNKVSETDIEEVYYHDNKIVVLVKDKEIGKQIYDIVKTLKDRGNTIKTRNITFGIDKYIIDKQGSIQLFCVDFNLEGEWSDYSKTEKLQELLKIVDNMQDQGYVLDSSRFECEKCSSISAFLSFFVLDDKEVEVSKGCLIKHIHYVLSDGGNLDEFYQKIVDNNMICKVSEFPYKLPVVTMCYNYFVTGDVPDNIFYVLQRADDYENYNSCLIASKSSFEPNFALIEDNDEYTIYDGNIKIYHDVSSDFEIFLRDGYKILEDIMQYSIEQLDTIIIDFNGRIIGYKFFSEELKDGHTIMERKFESQSEIFNFMSAMSNYFFNVMYTDIGEVKNDFSIEKSLICVGEYNIRFKITNIKELYNLACSDEYTLKEQITIIFFKLYLVYLKQKYGEISDKEQFLDKKEVRYLCPAITEPFINYALGRRIECIDSYAFCEFLKHTKKSDIEEGLIYDERFEYDPGQTPFIFDYEAERKYGIKIKRGMNKTLSDGRILTTFKQSKRIYEIRKDGRWLYKQIGCNHVKAVGISEIIYSKDIYTDACRNWYDVVGYITNPIKGKRLTDKFLLTLSNKELLKVIGHLFIVDGELERIRYIPLDMIWMDSDFKFYTNILDENFHIEKCPYGLGDKGLVNWITCYFVEKGYNPNAFVDLDFSRCSNQEEFLNYLLNLANSFDAYCDEHGIYYDSAHKMCPVCLESKCFVTSDFKKNAKKIFKDLYAKHYRFDSHYNLKVYKTSCIDMAEVEENIDKIIRSRLYSIEPELGQDCFVPYKKAIDENNQFIGYIYEAVEFSNHENDINVCNDIKDSQKLKNLPRLMSLIRLIMQVKEITQRNYGFMQNPFTHVFLSKIHKRQVQILNVEFLSDKGSVEDTIKWTYEYVCEILASDTSIEVDISESATDLDSILEILQNSSKDMTKYCSIHNMYYKNSYSFCPKCISATQMESIEVEEVEESEITQLKCENEGGESFIYGYGHDLVAKVFKEGKVNYDLKSIVIARVLGKKEVLEGNNNETLKYKYILPKKLLKDKTSGRIFGYTMDKISGMPLSSLKDKAELEKLKFTKKDVFEILISVGQGIENLHANNIYIGDLNSRNVLFDIYKNVYFLDFDGMGIDDITPEACTDRYIDPLSKKRQNITMQDDWYSFAVQAFYYLTLTHPFNGIYCVKENGEERILDIPDRMERRISLLGNHGIKLPAIAEPWDWMNEELKMAFLNIFESDSRESIVPQLICQYEEMYKSKPIRINPKFIATKLTPFDGDVIRIINHYAVVRKIRNKFCASLLINNDKGEFLYNIYNLPDCKDINDILLSEDNETAFEIYEDLVKVIDLKKGAVISRMKFSNMRDVAVNGSTLYCTGLSKEDNVIFKIDFTSNGSVKEEEIRFLPKQETKKLCVKFNSKFVLVKRASDNVDEIYCNSEKLCDMSYNSENSEYNIIYDDATKSWLVINSEGNGIVIKASKGTYKRFNIQEGISDINIGNISFNKGIIYIPSQDYLYIINVNDQITTKKMECNKVMTPESKLYDINTNGFSVITNNMLYEIRRG